MNPAPNTSPGAPEGRVPGEVLIDNSTYFSARHLLHGGRPDAYTVFNLANFLECMVVADRVVLAPTLAWNPSSEDTLFGPGGLCAKITLDTWSDDALGRLFNSALVAGARYLGSPRLWVNGGYATRDVGEASELHTGWRAAVDKDARAFLDQYSGAVLLTDAASEHEVAQLTTATDTSASAGYHLAQYLLRTNVAYELSANWVYHPHSHRTSYIAQRMRSANRRSLDLALALLRATESQLGRELKTARRSALLAPYGAFRHEQGLPLVLAVVLRQSRTPGDILTVALDLRDTKSARRFRSWVNKLVQAMDSNDFALQTVAENELRDASAVFRSDLRNLYDLDARDIRGDLLDKTAILAGTLDPSAVDPVGDGQLSGIVAVGLKAIGQTLPDIQRGWRERRQRRNVVFLLDMAKDRGAIPALNPLLKSVFGEVLDDEQLTRLHQLRSQQHREGAAILSARGS